MEAQGETEFLNKLLCVYAAAEQQKHSHTLRQIEENISIVTRAIRRMLWLMLGGALLLWGNYIIAEWLPPALSTFGAKIAGCLLIGAGISFISFTAYRAFAQHKLELHRQHCRALLEAALDWRTVSHAALNLQNYAPTELQCSRCGTRLLATPAEISLLRDRPTPAQITLNGVIQRPSEKIRLENPSD